MESTPITTQALPAGTRIEEFVIERVLGSGGFGITYLATDTSLGRQVVIKENLPVQFCFRDPSSLTVSPRHSSGDDADNFQWSLENFSKEAAMVASLDHSGIVRVHRSFQAFGTAYFVMPFVEGMALDELAKEREGKPFSEKELRGLLERVLGALGYLHERGIYHRDLKPGNLLITHAGIPVLIDFGSARQRLSERSMTVVESAGYTPFEQLQSRGNVGPWSDLYALGGTLVKAITGETLPKANDRVFDDPWQAMADREELLSVFSPGFLQSLDRALALHPRDRWQDAGEWLEALNAAPVHAPAAPPIVTAAEIATAQIRALVEAESHVADRHVLDVSGYQPGEERDFDLVEGCKIRMCWIPPGEFLMGSPEDEVGRRDDETQHWVTITEGFWMGKYPVTQEQWRAVMGTHQNNFGRLDLKTRLKPDAYKKKLEKWGGHPIEGVSWQDICGDQNKNGGFLNVVNFNAGDGQQFDLPTEAQWEYASRGGVLSSSNNEWVAGIPEVEWRLGASAWYCMISSGMTHPVGMKQSNAWGLHDMLGNVWEWCADLYGVYLDSPVIDPKGVGSGKCRVLRGGAWSNDAIRCRFAGRDYNFPTHASDSLGFRLVSRPFS
jgi:formylglycine-generating enzyme required for sulfatase activity